MKNISIKKISKLLPFIGIIIFIYIIINIGAEKIFNAYLLIPIQLHILALILFIPVLVLSVYKWLFICKKQKMDFGIIYLMKIYMISMFYGTIIPGGIGWHMRIYYLKKKSHSSWEKCIANSLLDSNSDFIAGLFLALIGSLIFIKYVSSLFTILFIFFIFHIIVFVVLMKKESGNKFFNIFIRPFIPAKFKKTIDQSIELLYEDLPRVRDMFFPFLISSFTWIISGTQIYIIASAFSIEVPYISFLLISIISVATALVLPISFAGLGIREGTLLILLSIFGVQHETAFAISIGGYLVRVLVPGLIGWIISLKKIRKL
jgi:uncharacterized protein (TIRG00374 family)